MQFKGVRAQSAVIETSLGEGGLHALQRREDRRTPLLKVENTHKHVAVPAVTQIIGDHCRHTADNRVEIKAKGDTGQAWQKQRLSQQ